MTITTQEIIDRRAGEAIAEIAYVELAGPSHSFDCPVCDHVTRSFWKPPVKGQFVMCSKCETALQVVSVYREG